MNGKHTNLTYSFLSKSEVFMNFYFCENCGRRLTEHDIRKGSAKDKKLRGVFCIPCSEGVVTMERLPMTESEAAHLLPQKQKVRTAKPVPSATSRAVAPRTFIGLEKNRKSRYRTPIAVAGTVVGLLALVVGVCYLLFGAPNTSTAPRSSPDERNPPSQIQQAKRKGPKPDTLLPESISESPDLPESVRKKTPQKLQPVALPSKESLNDFWQLVDQRLFVASKALNSYYPYYVFQAGGVGRHSKRSMIQWHHYSDEPRIAFNPQESFLLDASRVFDRWVRLSKQTPHSIRWVVTFQPLSGTRSADLEPDGFIFRADDHGAIPIQPEHKQILTLTRRGDRLTARLDDAQLLEQKIARDDRTPLRVTAQVRSVLLFSSKLYFGIGERLVPAKRNLLGNRKAPKWEICYAQTFSDADGLKDFSNFRPAGRFVWSEEDKALEIGPRNKDDHDEAYAMLKHSIPGDFRIRFRGRSVKARQPAFFGLLASIAGQIRKEDGYYFEWNYWQVQIKRRNARKAGKEISYSNLHKKSSNDWLQFKVERIDGELTMYTEGREVLRWKDPHAFKDSTHDLFSFYTWRVPMQFDDLIIERNTLDPVLPRKDQPVVPKNYLEGNRDGEQDQTEYLDF